HDPDEAFQPAGGATEREQVANDALPVEAGGHGVSGGGSAAAFGGRGRLGWMTGRPTWACSRTQPPRWREASGAGGASRCWDATERKSASSSIAATTFHKRRSSVSSMLARTSGRE